MDTRAARSALASFGVRGFAFLVMHNLLNKIGLFRVLMGMTLSLEDVDPGFLQPTVDYTARFLSRADCKQLVMLNPECGLSESFVDVAYDRGDRCYAFVRGNTLASYGWYSSRPDQIVEGLWLHFGERYVYMYKGFTSPDHRGRRLHAFGMAATLREFSRQGFDGLISYVEAQNYPSLRSTARLGYKVFGTVLIFRLFGFAVLYHSRRCRDFGFEVRRQA